MRTARSLPRYRPLSSGSLCPRGLCPGEVCLCPGELRLRVVKINLSWNRSRSIPVPATFQQHMGGVPISHVCVCVGGVTCVSSDGHQISLEDG